MVLVLYSGIVPEHTVLIAAQQTKWHLHVSSAKSDFAS